MRILAFLASVMFMALIYACPIFHGIPAPNGFRPLVIILMVFLGMVSLGFLCYAILGNKFLDKLM